LPSHGFFAARRTRESDSDAQQLPLVQRRAQLRGAYVDLWGAPRIHGELLKLGFEVAQSRVKNSLL
jgi:hypothetical protein